MDDLIQVQWTANHLDEARDITEGLLDRGLVACVSILPLVESWYIWEDEVECNQEVKVLMKTAARHYNAVDSYIRKKHSNEVPEILMFRIEGGHEPYLKWISDTVDRKKHTEK